MMLLKSTNPMFSWIISKNPETQKTKNEPFKKSLRKGTIYGWFFNDNEFRMHFVDDPTRSSFNTVGEYEYLDRTRYASPYLPIAAINELLRSAQQKLEEHDKEGFVASFECIAELSSPALAIRSANLSADKIEMTEIAKKLYRIKFETEKGVHHLLNLVIGFLISQAVADENLYIPVDEGSITKYIDAMNVTDAPYYQRYSLSMRVIRSPNLHAQVKNQLEIGKYIIGFGDTQNHRFQGLAPYLNGGDSDVLVDVGCGEMYYEKKVHMKFKKIFAFDPDDNLAGKNKNAIEVRNLTDKIEYRHQLFTEDCVDVICEDTTVLMTEVLEHMPKDEAIKLMSAIAKRNFKQVVISVPNIEFNQFYGLGPDQSRHDDHHYEPSVDEIAIMVNNSFPGHSVKFFGLGDAVKKDDRWIFASTGCVIKKG